MLRIVEVKTYSKFLTKDDFTISYAPFLFVNNEEFCFLTVFLFPCSSFRCFFFGDVSSKRDPTAYLSYASSLYDYYRKEYHSINKTRELAKIELPLIINTPGWVKGILLF